jgi:hypothetical protein
MRKIVTWLKSKSKIVVAITTSAIVGGATTAAALAAIPDSNGVIHACYRSSGLVANGSVRIVENAEACNNNETPITWNQQGPAGPAGADLRASGYILADGTLDQAHTVNVTAFKTTLDELSQVNGFCLKTTFVPVLGHATEGTPVEVRSPSMPVSTQAVESACGSDYNVWWPGRVGTEYPFVIERDPTYN